MFEEPQVSWGEQIHGMWYFHFSALTALHVLQSQLSPLPPSS